MSYRAEYIRRHYSLTCEDGVWVARMGGGFSVISGPDRERVVREARCRWGHFNFQDEVDAFNEIFRRAS